MPKKHLTYVNASLGLNIQVPQFKTYCALVGGGGGIVPIGPDDIIGGTMGITGAASGSFCWLGCTTKFCPLF